MTIYNETPPTDLLIIAQGAFNDATDNTDMAYQERLLAFAEAQASAQIATAKLLAQLLERQEIEFDRELMTSLYTIG